MYRPSKHLKLSSHNSKKASFHRSRVDIRHFHRTIVDIRSLRRKIIDKQHSQRDYEQRHAIFMAQL